MPGNFAPSGLLPDHFSLEHWKYVLGIPYEEVVNPATGEKRVVKAETPPLVWFWNSIKISAIATIGILLSLWNGGLCLRATPFQVQIHDAQLAPHSPDVSDGAGVSRHLCDSRFPRAVSACTWPEYPSRTHSRLPWRNLGLHLDAQGFDTIPASMEEAARIDGATQFQTFTQILLPMSLPIFAVVLLSFIAFMSEYPVASIVLQARENWTLAVGANSFLAEHQSRRFAALAVLSGVPITLIFLVCQKFVVSGRPPVGLRNRSTRGSQTGSECLRREIVRGKLRRRDPLVWHSPPSDFSSGPLRHRRSRTIRSKLLGQPTSSNARQKWWQILPLGPTGYGDSPYQCFSAFAGNPLLISPELLAKEGLLMPDDLAVGPFGKIVLFSEGWWSGKPPCWLGHGQISKPSETNVLRDALEKFSQRSPWLEDFCLFMSLKEAHGGVSWLQWPEPIRLRQEAAIADARRELAERMARHRFVQFLFFRQWSDLKRHANERGIQLIGTCRSSYPATRPTCGQIPIYFISMSTDSRQWSRGCLPDYFSATGQLWGNPLYNWEALKLTNYRWWLDRLVATLEQVDMVRLDHFRGFEAYWEVPATETTAINGRWVSAPAETSLALPSSNSVDCL